MNAESDDGCRVANWLRLAAGDGNARIVAIESLYAEFRRPVRGFYQRHGLDAHLAEDLLQDVFVQIVHRAESFRGHGDGTARSWIWTIARNRMMDHFRGLYGGEHVSVEDLVDELPAEVCATSSRDLDECLWQALRDFSKAHPMRAEALRRAELEGLSVAQVADYLGRTADATRQFLSQCRKHFRTYLERCRQFMTP
jgi:RNA polymerase sigma-70 factor, ECF subfamily